MFNSVQGLAWAPGGEEIWFTATPEGSSIRALYAVTLSGALRLVAQMPASLLLQDIAADGRVLLTSVNSRSAVYFVGPDETNPRDMTWLDFATNGTLSPDGKSICIAESGSAARGMGIYLRGTDGSPAARLSGPGVGPTVVPLAFSPDGKWVAASATASDAHLVLLPVKAGKPVAIDSGRLKFRTVDLVSGHGLFWFPDSERILYPAMEPERPIRTWVQDVQSGPPRPVTPEGYRGVALAADGATVLALDSESKAWLFRLNGGAPKLLPFLTPVYIPMTFSADGRSVYARKEGEPKIWRVDLATGRIELGRELPYIDPAGYTRIAQLVITPDGKSLAYTLARSLSELYLVEGLK
jgi:hypothetical protein